MSADAEKNPEEEQQAVKRSSIVSASKGDDKQVEQQRRLSKTSSKTRKNSYGFSSVIGLKDECQSGVGIQYKRPPLTYSPTYQLDSNNPFHISIVEEVVTNLLEEKIHELRYNSMYTPEMAILFSTEVLRKLKSLKFNRYRLLVVTAIGQNRAQSYNNAISFIWDTDRDQYVNVHMKLSSVFIQVTVFGVYLD